MGAQFAWSAAEFTEEIRQLGPNPLKIAVDLEKDENEPIIKEANHI